MGPSGKWWENAKSNYKRNTLSSCFLKMLQSGERLPSPEMLTPIFTRGQELGLWDKVESFLNFHLSISGWVLCGTVIRIILAFPHFPSHREHFSVCPTLLCGVHSIALYSVLFSCCCGCNGDHSKLISGMRETDQ